MLVRTSSHRTLSHRTFSRRTLSHRTSSHRTLTRRSSSHRTSHTTPSRHTLSRWALALLLALSCALAHSQDGIEVGIAAYPAAGTVAGLHVSVPLLQVREVTHALRADLSHVFGGLPGVAATWLLSGAPAQNEPERYLGAGLGLSFAESQLDSALLSAHGLVGVRMPISGGLHAFGEATVAGNALGSGLGLGVGLGYSFGGLNR